MRANRYLHIAVICATLLFLVLWQTAAAQPPEKPGNLGLPGCLAKVSELEDRIEELEGMLQNFAAVQQTGQKTSYYAGDDGDLQLGVQWPDPRFTDNGDGTVTDHLSGLIWLKNADCFGGKTWREALDACNTLADGQCGLSDDSSPEDWHLPNVRELASLIDYDKWGPPLPFGHPFTDVALTFYWSSTTLMGPYGPSADYAWGIPMHDGLVGADRKDYDGGHVLPVRGGND